MKAALMLTTTGLIVEVFCIRDITPATFIIFAVVSVPLVAAGIVVFVTTIWRVLRQTGGL